MPPRIAPENLVVKIPSNGLVTLLRKNAPIAFQVIQGSDQAALAIFGNALSTWFPFSFLILEFLFPTLILLTQCFVSRPFKRKTTRNMQARIFGFRILRNPLGNFSIA